MHSTSGAKAITDGTLDFTATTNAVTTTGGAGSVFLVFVTYYSIDGDTLTDPVTDSKSNTYVELGTTLASGSNDFRYVYACEGGTGGASHTFSATVNNTSNNAYLGIAAIELTGCATSTAVR